MQELMDLLSASLLGAAAHAVGLPTAALRLRIPARGAAAACPLLHTADAKVAAARLDSRDFPLVLGVRPVSRVDEKNGWLLFTLSDAFYSAAADHVRHTLPLPPSDGGRHAINRLLVLARTGGDGCPADARVQRAWLLTLCAYTGGAASARAEHALLSMTHHVSAAERAALAASCGGVADAAARLLFCIYKQQNDIAF